MDVPVEDGPAALAIVEVGSRQAHEHYLLAFGPGDEVADAFDRPEVAARLASLAGVEVEGAAVRSLGVEQSNSSVVLDERHVLKLYGGSRQGRTRSWSCGRSPARIRERAAAGGALETGGPPLETALASVTALVPALGGGWELALDSLGDDLVVAPRSRVAARRGDAALHAALAAPTSTRTSPRRSRARSRGAARSGDRGGDRGDLRDAARGRRARAVAHRARTSAISSRSCRGRGRRGSRSGRTATTTSGRCSGRRTATGS